MKKNQLKWLPIIVFGVFSLIVLVRPMLFGFDPYYYYSLSCGTANYTTNESILSEYFWPILNCDVNLFKILILLCSGLFLYFSYLAGKTISKDYGAILPLLFGLSPIFFQTLANAEDDLLGLPFIGLSLLLLVKYTTTKDKKYFLAGLFPILLGSLFWKGILVWLVIYLLANPITSLVDVFLINHFRENIFIRNYLVSEDIPVAGILTNSLLVLGIFFLPKQLFFPATLAFILSLFKLKYSLYLTLLGALGVFFYLSKKNFFWEDQKIVLGLPKKHSMLTIIVLINIVGMFGVYSTPSQDLLSFAERNTKIANDGPIMNDWELGHFITTYGGKPSNSYGPPDPDYNKFEGYAFTRQRLPCKVIDEYKPYYFYHC